MIRKARERDLPLLESLVETAADSCGNRGICQDTTDTARAHLVAEWRTGTLYVQESNGKVNGMFALCEKSAQPDTAVRWSNENANVLENFAVAADGFSRDEGEKMLRAAQRLAQRKGCDSLRGSTPEGNLRMRRLFARCGFRLAGWILPQESTQRLFCYDMFVCGQSF